MQNKGKGKTNSGFEGKINDPMYVFSSSFHFPFHHALHTHTHIYYVFVAFSRLAHLEPPQVHIFRSHLNLFPFLTAERTVDYTPLSSVSERGTIFR